MSKNCLFFKFYFKLLLSFFTNSETKITADCKNKFFFVDTIPFIISTFLSFNLVEEDIYFVLLSNLRFRVSPICIWSNLRFRVSKELRQQSHWCDKDVEGDALHLGLLSVLPRKTSSVSKLWLWWEGFHIRHDDMAIWWPDNIMTWWRNGVMPGWHFVTFRLWAGARCRNVSQR